MSDDELTPAQIETLASRFRDAGCEVTGLGGEQFEIVWPECPVRTHVLVNPYYVQLGTMIFAGGKGFLPNRKSKVLAFLNHINREAKLVKFTLDVEKPDAERGGWRILAMVKLVTGVSGGDYPADALKNIVLLWYQDIAELRLATADFDLHFMMRED